jgi:uncharacterized protein (TIGR00299 family) protein
MKIAYFDCFSGISGDMAVGALLDAGVPLGVLEDGLAQLGLDGSRIQVVTRSITRSQIHATKFDLLTPEGQQIDRSVEEIEVREGEHLHHEHAGHSHEHSHGAHEHGRGAHDHDHTHEHHAEQNGHEHGSYADIVAMIERSTLAAGVKEMSRGIFKAIAVAEARIHNTDVDDVHFHEVGGLDSIVDIVGVAICLEHLGVQAVYSSPVPLGSGGMIRTQHGVMPLPAPATIEILKGYPVRLTELPYELTTPTGAGIIKALSQGALTIEQLQVERIGFGAGTRELPDRPNLLRVVIGEKLGEEQYDLVVAIEANIDDMSPQVYPYLIERLLETGALDAWLTSIIMKKGRPGMLLSVLAPQGALDELTKLIYRETTTIGVRYREMSRRKLPREAILVDSEFGPVRMKSITASNGLRISPEYDEVSRIARERAIPFHIVLRKLETVARRLSEE